MAEKIVIASGKGGVGKSSVCTALARAMSERNKNVLIVDCDKMRSIDLLLGTGENIVYDWADAILGRCSVEEAIYREKGVSMMACPKDYSAATIGNMKALVQELDKKFDYIFFDSPAGVELGFILACSVCTRGLIVSLPDPISTRSACIAAEEMKKYGVCDVRLIINRMAKFDCFFGKILGVDSVIDSTEVQLIGIVPEDKKIRRAAMGGGIYEKGNASYKAFSNIAARLEGENRKLNGF
ncbi:MAG: P-loop NTPase [Acutalibacteraceae bacterium]